MNEREIIRILWEHKEPIVYLIYWLYKKIPDLRKQIIRENLQNLQKDLFFPMFPTEYLSSVSSDMGREHPAFIDGVHPHNRIVAEEVARSIISSQRGKVRSLQNYMKPNRERDLILFGGPVSTLTTSLAMGYDRKDLEKEPRTNLRFIFYLNKKDLSQIKYKTEGETLEEPNYYILDRDKSIEYRPRDVEGYLVDDFLLINVIPNNLAKRKNRFIVNFAGCHGIGTEAAALVLKNEKILQEIKKEKEEEVRAFQSIIHVTEVKQGKDRFRPLKVNHIKTTSIETKIF